MLTEILVEALTNMDYDTLEHVLESCNEEELAFVDEVMEMSKADFKAENVNTFKRNDHLKSFKLDNGTGLTSKDFDNIKGSANDFFKNDAQTLDNTDNARELFIRSNNIADKYRQKFKNQGVDADVAQKIAQRVANIYTHSAVDASDRAYGRREDRAMNEINRQVSDAIKKNELDKYMKAYDDWAERENKKLRLKYTAAEAKQKLLQKLDKLRPSDLKR